MTSTRSSLFAASLLATLAASTLACGGPEVDSDALDNTEKPGSTFTSFAAYEKSLAREKRTGIYIVDGDFTIRNEKLLREHWERNVQKGALIVAAPGGARTIWSPSQRMALRYCVSKEFGDKYSAVSTAMREAAKAWETVADVDFVHTRAEDATCGPTNTNVVFDVSPSEGWVSYLARAFFPNADRDARQVLIAPTAHDAEPWSLTGILRHELGHVLGFRHEHTRPEGECFEDKDWEPVSEYDQSSVMHYPHCGGVEDSKLEITEADGASAAELYGAPGAGREGKGNVDPGERVAVVRKGKLERGKTYEPEAFEVTEGSELVVRLEGTGDPDLYVRFDAKPTSEAYTCRPYLRGAAEECIVTVPEGAKRAYASVRAFDAGAYDLTIEHTRPTTNPTLEAGDLVITEIMNRPAVGLTDADSEWFEVYNKTDHPIDLYGLRIAHRADLPNEFARVNATVVVQPGAHVVLGNNADPEKNGGARLDYVYSTSVSLGDGADRLALVLRGRDGAPDTIIDEVTWADGSTIARGSSRSLAPSSRDAGDNDDEAAWCAGTAPMQAGFGSPGAANTPCP